MVVQLDEEGEYIRVFAPRIFKTKGRNTIALLRACMELQSLETSVMRFEYDERDGEMRAAIEFPVEDATVTFSQLIECVEGIFLSLEGSYPALQKAAEESAAERVE